MPLEPVVGVRSALESNVLRARPHDREHAEPEDDENAREQRNEDAAPVRAGERSSGGHLSQEAEFQDPAGIKRELAAFTNSSPRVALYELVASSTQPPASRRNADPPALVPPLRMEHKAQPCAAPGRLASAENRV